MPASASYRTPESLFCGVLMLLVSLGILSVPLWMTEDELLDSNARRSGLFKAVEQTIGWEAFSGLVIVIGIWVLSMAASLIWKAISGRPDVEAFADRIEFHPALRTRPARYDEIDRWSLQIAKGRVVLKLHFVSWFWSLQSKWPTKVLTIDAHPNDLDDLMQFLAKHPQMSERLRS